MTPRTLPLALLVLAAVGAIVFALADHEQPAPSVERPAALDAPSVASTAPATPDTPPAARAVEARYRVSYRFATELGDGDGARGRVEGTWRTRTLRGGRQAIWLEDVTLDGHEGLPGVDDLAGPVEVAGAPGRPIEGMGFPEGMSPEARRLYTTLATTFAYTDQPGAAYRVGEQDITGSYSADYTRPDEGVLSREVSAYTALRRGAQLVSTGHLELTPTGRTRFVIDRDGLAAADVDVALTVTLGEGMPDVRTTIAARLERVAIGTTGWAEGTLSIEPLRDHVDPARVAAAARDVDDRTLAELLAEVERVVALDAAAPDTGRWRSVTLRALTARVRRDPATAQAIADRIRSAPDATAEHGLLLGALGSADTPAAVDALVGLLDDELPLGSRRALLGHLALTDVGSPAAIETLTAAVDAGDTAALATLGSQARKLAGTDAAGPAVERLMQALTDAPDRVGTVGALRALGNAGAEQSLSAVVGLIDAPDAAVAEAAVFALRFMPAGEADARLEQVMQGGGRSAVAAARAVAYRDRDHWRPLLLQTEVGVDDRQLAAAIARTLSLMN